MKLVFLVFTILINFFNYSITKAEEKIDPEINKIENISKKEPMTEQKTRVRKIHIVKSGDSIWSISKLYSINKDLIIKLNSLKNENYIYVGQNLIISEPNIKSAQSSNLINDYHIVKLGESLTDISNKYKLNAGYLIEINNLDNPDSLTVGQKLLLSKNIAESSENHQIINNNKINELLELDEQIYGPIIIQNKSSKKVKGRTVLNVLNQKNKKLILSINCDKNELDVRIPGRKWRGSEPAKAKFEKDLINDFC